MLEDGLLSAGLIPACRHALAKLMLPDALVIPAAATVYAQAVQFRVDTVCGFDVSATNLYRWEPAHASGVPLAPGAYILLSEPVRVWHFDMLTPPEESDTQVVDLAFTSSGRFNAVLFWFDLHLGGGHILSTRPGSAVKTLQPALQYLPGELAVEAGTILGLRCSHNTVCMRFDLERESYVHLYKEDASFPKYHFSMLADVARAEAYQAAIVRQVAKRKANGAVANAHVVCVATCTQCVRALPSGGEVHVLDMGTGSGLLAMMAAQAGADRCDVFAKRRPPVPRV
jgi:protein arginine N-methyltransferase 7